MTNPGRKKVRTCVSCGAKDDKTSLLRIVRTPEGSVRFDSTGRMAGRGAYVCSAQCLAKALSGRKLQRALRTGVSETDAEILASEMEAALQGAEGR